MSQMPSSRLAATPAVTAEVARRRVAMVTNIPTPYRLPVYEKLAAQPGIELRVFFCSGKEPDREWNIPHSNVSHEYLQERFFQIGQRFVHANPDVWPALKKFKPDVVITTGFNPTHIGAFLYAKLHRKHHIAMTDGTLRSEQILSVFHEMLRRVVFSMTSVFVGACEGSFDLYRHYGIPPEKMFKSHLCANNAGYAQAGGGDKQYDFLFCARFVDIKNPLFALEVARSVAQRLGRKVSIALVGSGPMEEAMHKMASSMGDKVEVSFLGFKQQSQLYGIYNASRIFLFPTSWDPWGVVANEACASGVPVVVTPEAGATTELIVHERNGFVLDLDLAAWTDACARLLSDDQLYLEMSQAARRSVEPYTYDNAARGLAHAVRFALDGRPPAPAPELRPRPRRQRVLIVQRRMTHYRVPLFNELRRLLQRADIDLHVVYGTPTPSESLKKDSGELPWGEHVPCKYWLDGRLCWQNFGSQARQADLIVVTQENKLLFNHILRWVAPRSQRALWGHGKNFQTSRHWISEWIKSLLANRADWWFAYTQLSADVVRANGFPSERITVLNNTFDTSGLKAALGEISADTRRNILAHYGLNEGPVGLALGSLHVDKRMEFLLDAAQGIRARVPDFQLLVVGEGPQNEAVERAAQASGGWIRWLGALGGSDKAQALSVSTVLLNPGMVGLTIIDSLTAGVPMITTDTGTHSPEIVYLRPGVNGLITPNDLSSYVEATVGLLNNPAQLEALRRGCALEAGSLSIEDMAHRFFIGIEQCLSAAALKGVVTA